MEKLRRWWRRNVGPWEDVYVIEANPSGNGLHLHGWQFGSAVDRGDLARAAEVAGFLANPYGEPREVPDGAPLHYFIKTAWYQPAANTMPAHATRFLALNNRIAHKSHGFWRDWDDQPVGSLRRAVQLARGSKATGSWVATTI